MESHYGKTYAEGDKCGDAYCKGDDQLNENVLVPRASGRLSLTIRRHIITRMHDFWDGWRCQERNEAVTLGLTGFK